MVEVNVKYRAFNAEGLDTAMRETYLVDTLTFGDAEVKIARHAEQMSWREFRIRSMSESKNEGIIGKLEEDGERFYVVRISIETLNEKGVTKKKPLSVLVVADSTTTADQNARNWMEEGLSDYELLSIKESSIIDIIR